MICFMICSRSNKLSAYNFFVQLAPEKVSRLILFFCGVTRGRINRNIRTAMPLYLLVSKKKYKKQKRRKLYGQNVSIYNDKRECIYGRIAKESLRKTNLLILMSYF